MMIFAKMGIHCQGDLLDSGGECDFVGAKGITVRSNQPPPDVEAEEMMRRAARASEGEMLVAMSLSAQSSHAFPQTISLDGINAMRGWYRPLKLVMR